MSKGIAPIKVLVPKMPTAEFLMPYIKLIDSARWYTNFGQLERALRDRLEKMYGAYVVTTSSATSGLELVYRQEYEIGGPPIGIPSLTFSGTVHAIARSGLGFHFCDVDPDTWTAPSVATFGVPVHGPIVDAAAAIGEQHVAPNQICVFSLHATKVVGSGEGGYIVLHDKERAEELRRQTNFGIDEGTSYEWGTNAKMSEYHAAIAMASLDAYEPGAWHQLFDWYDKYLPKNVTKQERPRGVYPILSVRTPHVAVVVQQTLKNAGIETRRWYCPPMHQHPDYVKTERRWRPPSSRLPVTNSLVNHLVGLPYHLFLTENSVKYICETLERAVSE